MAVWEYSLRLGIALVLGAVIGLERQFSRQMAGIRTNALICLGACLFCLISFQSAGEGDAFRLAAAVVTGIGFLGGGVIVRDGFTIKGLTTAATMWCTSAVGVAVAIGYLLEAAVATGLVLLINFALRPLSKKVRTLTASRPSHTYQYHLIVACKADMADGLRPTLAQICEASRLLLMTMDEMPGIVEGTLRYAMLLQSEQEDKREVERLMALILSHPGIVSAAWDTVEEQE